MKWTIVLPLATPSGNVVLRQHFRTRAVENLAMAWHLAGALNKLPKIPPASGKRRLTVERHGKKALDADNLAAGAKGLIDAVKASRLILDDNPDVCELVFRQSVDRILAAFTVLILEDCA